jgi:peptide subunit release factor 1 (eRF1)
MITRERIRELAAFESSEGCAVTFYFQPSTPQNKSHREERILVKDRVREALREAEREGARTACARGDLRRILEVAERLHGNSRKAKAIFADKSKGIWREFDLPAWLPGTQLIVNRRFHLKPLATVLEHVPTVCVCLIDRTKARLFRYQNEKIEEMADFFNQLPRRGRSDGWAGYDAGHAERHVLNDAKQHYKFVADTLLDLFERGSFEMLAVGCHDDQWADIEPMLHAYLGQRLLGHFRIDPATAGIEQIKAQVEKVLERHLGARRQGLVREVLGQAHRNGRGALGLRRVLRSLETREVQTLLLGNKFKAPGYECQNCGHIDMRVTDVCAMCGQKVRELDDISDALLANAMRNGIEVMYIENDSELEQAGHIAALLRFRADQSTAMKQAG